MKEGGVWCCYSTEKEKFLKPDKCGKWMIFFSEEDFAKKICSMAVEEKVCYACKCSNLSLTKEKTGVICFYINYDDIEYQSRIINFMLNNNLIQRTKEGKLYNLSFKFDTQTINGEYGENFTGRIKLDNFIDLDTGRWKTI